MREALFASSGTIGLGVAAGRTMTLVLDRVVGLQVSKRVRDLWDVTYWFGILLPENRCVCGTSGAGANEAWIVLHIWPSANATGRAVGLHMGAQIPQSIQRTPISQERTLMAHIGRREPSA